MLDTSRPGLILIHWGIAQFQAALVTGDARTIRRIVSDDGVQSIQADRFQHTLHMLCGAWFAHYPDVAIAMTGAVGGAGGWLETPYVSCPCDADILRRNAVWLSIGRGRRARVIPGVQYKGEDQTTDVMRGEEALALGSGVMDGIICIPGAHTKWIEMRNGMIVRFETFMTGEAYTLFSKSAVPVRAMEIKEDNAGFDRGLAAAWRNSSADQPSSPLDLIRTLGVQQGNSPGRGNSVQRSLLHTLFEARTGVATGRMNSRQIGPFLWGLLIGEELMHAAPAFGNPRRVSIIGEGEIASLYAKAFATLKIATQMLPSERCRIDGLRSILPDTDVLPRQTAALDALAQFPFGRMF